MEEAFDLFRFTIIAFLPGALYVWAFERVVGKWGGVADRAFQFVGGSAIFGVLAAPLTYWFWVTYVVTGRFAKGDISLLLWVLPLSYVGIPIAIGTIVGRGTKRQARWVRFFTGSDPAPRAWDYLFGSNPDGWIRLRLKSGIWLAGAFAQRENRRSYAAGYPESPDLYLVQTAMVDPIDGSFLFDAEDEVRVLDSSLLIRWDEVEFLEFIDR